MSKSVAGQKGNIKEKDLYIHSTFSTQMTFCPCPFDNTALQVLSVQISQNRH